MTLWAERAAALYDEQYARQYRAHDEELVASIPYQHFVDWLRRVCALFRAPIDVLDLGCGTGRYFWTVTGVRELVGLDVSSAMLAEATQPYNERRITAASIRLVRGDLLTHEFEAGRFDLVYSIGVLAEHVPLDSEVVSRVTSWLRPHGRFAFSTVHPDSPSVPQTVARRIGHVMVRAVPHPIRRPLRTRLLARGLYADEARVRELLEPAFVVEAVEPFQSEAHLHCLCVARKVAEWDR